MDKKTIAVFFGGQSTEHDISILAGLAVMQAIDRTKFNVEPIYIDFDGNWYNGEALKFPNTFHLSKAIKKTLNRVEFPIGRNFENDRPHCDVISRATFFGDKKIYFDVAFLAFLGAVGEDGVIQGVFSTARVPFVNSDVQAASIYMNKVLTKMILRSAGVPVLPEITLRRPEVGMLDISEIIKGHNFTYPACVKPVNLGSSVGVRKVENEEELKTALVDVFRLDFEAMVEPFVENLVEYNVAVCKAFDGEIVCSAIEKPTREDALLSFEDKYCRGASKGKLGEKFGSKFGSKLGTIISGENRMNQGMAAMGREMNPAELTAAQKELILNSAKIAMQVIGGAGTPRVDFVCNSVTGEIWLNEINTIPGMLAYYLWEASEPRVPFTKLIDALIEEAYRSADKLRRNVDLKSAKAALFPDR
ncbi:MAG: hypothetical protein LBE20_01445 [Deltaproteobacteria bacterium]|jgi:D-alanine-D-alanine ligase|nr:hypothetical protein [Deltaproteobacteria bacterium]